MKKWVREGGRGEGVGFVYCTIVCLLQDLIGRFFTESTSPNVDDMMRQKCLDVCKILFTAFEPVATILLIRRLVFLIWHNEYKSVLRSCDHFSFLFYFNFITF